MKKVFQYFLTLLLASVLVFSNVSALEVDDVYSNEVLLINFDSGDVLFSKNTHEEAVPIASLTKLMTYAVVIENVEDIDNTMVTVPFGVKQNNINKGASTAKLEDGYSYSIKDLLYGLLVPSGCDAADTLAYYVSDGNYSKFVEMMNQKATELGMSNTIFYNSSGLEEDGKNSLSTEQDLYKLIKYVYNLPYFKDIIKTEFYVFNGYKGEKTIEATVRNSNYMIGEYNGAEYFYQYSLGGKTGNLSVAGRCLISFAKKGNLELLAITLGVPNEHHNYHLTDHTILFDYGFENFSENITVDIGSEYKSVNVGKKIKILPITSSDTIVKWSSSDDTIASVDEFGVVTGKKLGRVKIVATTSTGNQDYCYVSVGFYNGIDIKYSSGPSDSNGILGYGKLDWELVKNSGIDFAVIRAGYALRNNPDSDPYFVDNILGALNNKIDILISFDGYATTKEHAKNEALYLIDYLNDNISEQLNNISLPIVYNLYNANTSNPQVLFNVASEFKSIMNNAGFDVIVKLGKTKFSTMDIDKINEVGIDAYIIWRATIPDFSTRMSIEKNDVMLNAMLWEYRTDGYLGSEGINKKITMSAMYMDYKKIDTVHEEYIPVIYPDKPNLKIEKEYIYNGNEIVADVIGYDSNFMNINGNIQVNAGTYKVLVTPKFTWSDGTKDAVEVNFVIKKANPIFELPNDLVGIVGEELNTISLSAGFKWQNEKEKLCLNVDKYNVVYIPEDKNNYNIINTTLDVKVNKKIMSLKETLKYDLFKDNNLLIILDEKFEITNNPEIYIGNSLLNEDDYEIIDNILIVNKNFISQFSKGIYNIKIEFASGYIFNGELKIEKTEKKVNNNVNVPSNNKQEDIFISGDESSNQVIDDEVKDVNSDLEIESNIKISYLILLLGALSIIVIGFMVLKKIKKRK